MGAVAESPVPLASSVLASGMRGCRGSEDDRAGRPITLKHGVEESDRLGEESLAAIFHRFTAADADLTIFAALNAARVLDVLSSTPARPDSRSPCENSHLHALASRIGEILRLARRSGYPERGVALQFNRFRNPYGAKRKGRKVTLIQLVVDTRHLCVE